MSAHIQIIGNVGSTPEMRNHNGTEVTSVNLAVTDKWTDDQGEKKESTLWYTASFWGKSAKNAVAYIKKGDQLCVTASGAKARAYMNNNGEPAASIDLVNARFELLRNGRNGGGQGSNEAGHEETGNMDDIPF